MISNFFSRFWGGDTNGVIPYFGTEMRNTIGKKSKNPESLAGVRRCVAILSDGICSTSLNLVRSLPTGGKEIIAENQIAKALKRLRYADLELVMQDALYLGNGFLRVIRDGESIRFKAIPAWRVSIAVTSNGDISYLVAKDTTLSLNEETLRTNEIIHIKYRVDQSNPLVGISPLRASSASMSAIVETYYLQERLAVNLANTGLILSTDVPLNVEQTQKLRTNANEKAQQFMSGGTVILSHGIKPVPSHISQSIKDNDLIEAMRFSIEEISRLYGIPPSMLGYSQHTSFATASEERRAFATNTLKPLMARVADAFIEALLSDTDINESISIEFDASDFGAGQELATTLSTLVNSGILSTNEARNRVGLKDVANGDVIRSPANVMPIDSWLTYFEQNKTNGTPQ